MKNFHQLYETRLTYAKSYHLPKVGPNYGKLNSHLSNAQLWSFHQSLFKSNEQIVGSYHSNENPLAEFIFCILCYYLLGCSKKKFDSLFLYFIF